MKCSESCGKASVPQSDLEEFKMFSFFACGIFGSSAVLQLFQLMDTEVIGTIRVAPIYCTAVVNIVSCISHFFLATERYQLVLSPWDRLGHVARWGEVILLACLLLN